MTVEGHLIALALVGTDLAARTTRIRWLLGMVHAPMAWRDALCLNAWSDLAAALTPMRLGGEPARLAALRAFRVPMRPALGGLALELAIATPTTLLIGATLAALFGRSWVAAATAETGLQTAWLVAGGLAGMVAIGLWLRARSARSAPPAAWHPPRSGRAVLVVTLSTVVSVLSRVAILPALAIGSVEGGGLGAMLLGSFVLLFGQVLVPLPAGAGAVDSAFLGGAAGTGGVVMLVAWRAYTVGVGVVLGVLLLAWRRFSLRGLLRSGGLNLLPWWGGRGVLTEEVVEDRPPASAQGGVASPLRQSEAEATIGE